MPTETARLVTAAQRGDRAAFAELYLQFAPVVHGIVIARVSALDVEDIVHEVFIKAMQALATLHDPKMFPGWIAAIARNRAVDHLRRTPHTEDLPETLSMPNDAAEKARAVAVLAVLRSLPEAYRETLTLRLIEGMTGPEIALATGLTDGSVRVNLHRGMKLLRARLEGRQE
ncbi:MAG: sigma-70 family RNA polymerase sigma factor [Acidobacteriota bacterium]